MFLVKYSSGSYDDWYEIAIFVTQSEDVAKAYVEKFNNLLEKWKPIVEEGQNKNRDLEYKKSDFSEYCTIGFRYYDITEINEAKYELIEERI